jgi:hypothetical protein
LSDEPVVDMFYTYRFISDFAIITFSVPGNSEWSEEMWDSAANDDLASYVTEPDAYYLDECWQHIMSDPNDIIEA